MFFSFLHETEKRCLKVKLMLLEIIASIRFKKCLIQIFNVTYMRLLQLLSKTETRLSNWRVQLLHLLFLSLFKSDVIYKDQTITSMVLCLATYIFNRNEVCYCNITVRTWKWVIVNFELKCCMFHIICWEWVLWRDRKPT